MSKYNKNTLNRTLPMISNNQVQVISNQYYLVVGFEVNHIATAFRNNTQNLNVDYGHAFFFTVKNGKIITVYSFGPKGAATPTKRELAAGIDEFSGRRPATINYPITEVSRLYKFRISKKQLIAIKKQADQFKKKVISGEEKYTAYMNDTCAEAAKDVLDDANIDTPSGKGYITTPSGTANFLFEPSYIDGRKVPFTGAMFVNPYSWYDQFRTKYGQPFLYKHNGVDLFDPIYLEDKWKPMEGTTVPSAIAKHSYHSNL
ncbi:hypothetical protein [Psychrobacter immobilis]|uniref:hypothetical protein n=2 Tax=Moraxellaceae TaxID=468 RepID=UPI001917FFC3|nr:hypothetical protein [Psychrobacter immobilis]